MGRIGKLVMSVNVLCLLALACSYASPFIAPNEFWPIAFFGLAYPILLLLNLCFLLFWLLTKWKRSILTIIILLLGIPIHLRFFQPISTNEILPKENDLKVLSYNVRLFDWYNWTSNKDTRNEILQFLEQENPNILCLQEFFYQGGQSSFNTRDTLLSIIDAKNLHVSYTATAVQNQNFGIATFTTLPIKAKGEIKFEKTNNRAIFTDIESKSGKIIRVYNAHLASIGFGKADYDYINDKNNSEEYGASLVREQKIVQRLKFAFLARSKQTKKLLDHIESSPYPVVLCGDFNDTPISHFYNQVQSKLCDAFTETGFGIGSTYIGKFPSFRIDYIFHESPIHSFNFMTHDLIASDHHPVSCYLHLSD